MPEIRLLPPSVVNKIAAGEVIERPASVVKELLENSLDAGATRIEVAVEQGGLGLIRVADDGCGVAADQLPLAVASHATSKIRGADDLFQVRSLGFRGEALASIAEVSQFLMRSRTADAAAGAQLQVNAGELGDVAPCGCPVGTIVEIRNLFCNTPVRRKFLRSTQTELGHITEAFTRIALAHPQVHFSLRHNERTLYELPASERWQERLAVFFGRELNEALIWVEHFDSESASRLSGYVAHPSLSRPNNRWQYLFLNGRYIRDRSLQHALGEAYRGLLMTGRFPIAFLRLDMPPEAVDVNVHPTKLEVRFQDSGRVYSQLLSTLRGKFLSTDLTAVSSLAAAVPSSNPFVDDQRALDPAGASRVRGEMTAWARGESRPSPGEAPLSNVPLTRVSPGGGGFAASNDPANAQTRMPLRYDRPRSPVPPFRPFDSTVSGTGPRAAAVADSSTNAAAPAPSQTIADSEAGRPHAERERPSFGLQLHDRYLVTENEAGIVVIDQHALHERVLYEQLREKVLANHLETQRLLIPEPVSFTGAEAGTVLAARETLRTLGIEVEPFGGGTVLVSAYPAMLANISPAELLRQVVDLLLAGDKPPERRDLLDELLHMISCKAAIKAGERLSAAEVDALLEQRHLFQDTHHCPHGRPTALVLTREELDKRFKRT